MGAPLLERLRVFVASPGDVARERDHVSDLAEELNRGVAAAAGFVLEVVRWETHARPDLGRPQQLIFDQIGPVDLFIGIMWQRFGTPTGVADSGTEEEFNHALASWERKHQPRILCYFSRAPIEPPGTVEAAEQLLRVVRFRERVNGLGLAWTYRSDAEFKEKLREHLQGILTRELAGRRPPLDRNLLALLDVEKDRCRDRGVAFFTPNLLLALLAGSGGAVRRIFDEACPGEAERIVAVLRGYEPVDATGAQIPFSAFDWYDREDVQAARLRARGDGASAIDGRYLLLGFLDVESGTRTELMDALGDAAFERLRRIAGTRPVSTKTPGANRLFGRPGTPRDGG